MGRGLVFGGERVCVRERKREKRTLGWRERRMTKKDGRLEVVGWSSPVGENGGQNTEGTRGRKGRMRERERG